MLQTAFITAARATQPARALCSQLRTAKPLFMTQTIGRVQQAHSQSSSSAAAAAGASADASMDAIVSLCKRRGFVFQNSEIYNGFNGFYDYGPLGVELKNNLKRLWWRDFVQRRDNIVGLDCALISSPKVWEASGHIQGFSDPMVDCKTTRLRFRADQVHFAKVETEDGTVVGYVSVLESHDTLADATASAKKLLSKAKLGGAAKLKTLELKELIEATPEELAVIPSPGSGKPGDLTPPRDFNLMFKTEVGAVTDESAVSYLRPETAQGIFTNFKNVHATSRQKVPFGIAQIGKAFRNEITPRNFLFRTREFEQMEIEYFIKPDDDSWKQQMDGWVDACWNWLLTLGIREELLAREPHPADKLAHYAKACTDITFKFPFGQRELQGIAARGNFDLTQHQNHSGKSLEYYDDATKERYLPHVIEPSIGVDRLFLAVICSAYNEDVVDGEPRTILKFHPSVAPVKVGVFPLVQNKPELMSFARSLFDKIQLRYNSVFDTSGAIGRRYRRMDEIGTPYCITVDFDSLQDGTVTVRDRDTTSQVRMKAEEVLQYLSKQIDGF